MRSVAVLGPRDSLILRIKHSGAVRIDLVIQPQIRIRLESEYMTGFTEGLNALLCKNCVIL